jgi:hypothetical protein
MSADDQTSGERWLDMTNAAYDKVGFLLQVAEPERQAMWIEVTGTSANQWTCNISLKPLDAAAPWPAMATRQVNSLPFAELANPAKQRPLEIGDGEQDPLLDESSLGRANGAGQSSATNLACGVSFRRSRAVVG